MIDTWIPHSGNKSRIQVHPWLHRQLKTSLNYRRLGLLKESMLRNILHERYTNGEQEHEIEINLTSHQRNENLNHTERFPPARKG